MNLLTYFGILLRASLFSFSGMGNVPILHGDLVTPGWATDHQFAESLAVGQVAPGPNGLWVVSLGYLMHGVPGACLAVLAITVPPLLVLGVERGYDRVKHHPAVEGFIRGLSLAVIGVFAVVLITLLRSGGIDVAGIAILVLSAVLGATRKVPILPILVMAGVVGTMIYH